MSDNNHTTEGPTAANSTSSHEDGPSPAPDNEKDDDCSFEISTIRVSEDPDSTSPSEDEIENAPTHKPPPSPFRSRWVRGMHNPNRSFGSPTITSPIKKYAEASHIHTSTERKYDAEIMDGQIDASMMDASVMTNTLLESSFAGSDSTNARLEAVYMWTKRENNSLLMKIKVLEEEKAAKEQEKVAMMMSEASESSPLKWAKNMIVDGSSCSESSESSYASKTDEGQSKSNQHISKKLIPSQLFPSELQSMGDLEVPTLSPTTTISDLQTNDSLKFSESYDACSNRNETSRLRRLMSLVVLGLICTILSVHMEKFESAMKKAKTLAINAPIIERNKEFFNDVARKLSETLQVADARLQPAKEVVLPHILPTLTFCHEKFHHLSHLSTVEFDKAQKLLGFKLDWESDILPMANKYIGEQREKPLEGFNVVVVRASTEIGMGITDVFSKLGARVLAVDGSAKQLSIIKIAEPSVETLKVDFDDLVSVSKGADDIVESFGHIDALINCFSDFSRRLGQTNQGYEKHFGANYLSEFLLITKLLEPLNQSSMGALVQVQSMAHIFVDGSGLRIDPTTNQPSISVPGDASNHLAYANSLLARNLHNQYWSRTQKVLKVSSVTSAPYVTAMSVRSVLASVLGEDTGGNAIEKAHSSLRIGKEKLGLFKEMMISPGKFANPFEDEELQASLISWSEEAVSPYWWSKIKPKTVDILKETGSCMSDYTTEVKDKTVEYNAFYTSSIVTLLSAASLSLLRQLLPSRFGGK